MRTGPLKQGQGAGWLILETKLLSSQQKQRSMEDGFLHLWGEAAYTTLGFFWMALWAFVLG